MGRPKNGQGLYKWGSWLSWLRWMCQPQCWSHLSQLTVTLSASVQNLEQLSAGQGDVERVILCLFFRGFWFNWYLGLGELRFGEALGGTEGGFFSLGLTRDYMTSPLSFERETRLMVWVYKNSGWVHFSQIWPLFWKRRFGLEFLLFQTFHFSDKFCVKMEPAEPLYTCPPGLRWSRWCLTEVFGSAPGPPALGGSLFDLGEWFCASFFVDFDLIGYLGLGELRFGEALGGTEGGYVSLGLARDYMTSPLSFERETRLMVWVYKNSGWVHFSQIWPLFWKRRFGLEFLHFQTFHVSDKFRLAMRQNGASWTFL